MLGVLGGLGPGATANFLDVLVERTPAETDQEHIETLVYNDPTVPDRTDAILGDGESPLPKLVSNARLLDWAGAETIVIASNTTHHYHPEIADAVEAEVPHLVELVEDAISPHVETVGVVTTRPAVELGLYDDIAPTIVYPPNLDRVMDAMYAIKAGEREAGRDHLASVVGEMDPSIERFVIGCTDLSMVPWPGPEPVDAAEVMADYCVSRHHQ